MGTVGVIVRGGRNEGLMPPLGPDVYRKRTLLQMPARPRRRHGRFDNSQGTMNQLLEIQKLSDVIYNEYRKNFRTVAWIDYAISAAAMTS